MTDFPEQTYLITFRADEALSKVSTIREITVVATTTDPDDARVLAYQDLVDEFGLEVARHYKFVGFFFDKVEA